ncbi:hypothetical protein EU522_01205 [Candidatus Thorarchaeota archaeon]|nr:MAG: hypothetical protein EU522_01205 [Candidatus Thorarchaeota archaeon]
MGMKKVGDFILTHDDSGKAYLRRIIYLNVVLCFVGIIAFIVFTFDIIILVVIAIFGLSLSLLYVGYFIYKNPPIGVDIEE